MTAPILAINDVCLFATSDSTTKAAYGFPFHRRDVAQLVAPCTIVGLHEKKGSWPLSIRFRDKSELVATPNEIVAVLVPAELSEFAQAVEQSSAGRAVAA